MTNRKRFGVVCIVACVAILLMLWQGHMSERSFIVLWFTGAALALAGNVCIWTAE